MIRKPLLLAAVLAALLSVQAVVSQSGASTPAPSAPVHLRFVQAGDSYLQVASDESTNATGYQVFASTTQSDVNVSNISKAFKSDVASTPLMTLRGLPRTGKPYFWRVAAISPGHIVYSTQIGQAGLRPDPVTSLAVASSSKGTSLTWAESADWATGFNIAQSTSEDMTADRVDYTVGGATRRFTPYGLTPGTTYYYNVRAVNIKTPSSYATKVSDDAMTAEQTVRVDTYNLLKLTADGTDTDGPGGIISPWSQRRVKAAALVKASAPDVIAVQEGGYYTDKNPTSSSIRQVDSLVNLLPGYVVAPTETPNPPGYGQIHQTYVAYNSAVLSQVTSGRTCACGVFELDNPPQHRAVYSILQNNASGAKFLFVSVHLANPTYTNAVRTAEAQSMLQQVNAYNASHGNLPVIYGGDFNAYPVNDTPGTVLRRTLNEVEPVAQTKYRPTYSSYNGYLRTPPQGSQWLDRVFVTPGVGVKAWGPVLQLTSSGQFSGAIPSDHNPIYAAVTIPYAPAG